MVIEGSRNMGRKEERKGGLEKLMKLIFCATCLPFSAGRVMQRWIGKSFEPTKASALLQAKPMLYQENKSFFAFSL